MQRVLELKGCRVDLAHARVEREGRVSPLSGLEVALLSYLAQRPGVIVTRDELLTAVWGYSGPVVTRAVDNTIARLRVRIEVDPACPDHIITLRGQGYRYEPPAERPAGGAEEVRGAAGEGEEVRGAAGEGEEVRGAAGEGEEEGPGTDGEGKQGPGTDGEGKQGRGMAGGAEELRGTAGRMPLEHTSFIGRTAALARLEATFQSGVRLVTLLGPGGVGKTRVAMRWAGSTSITRAERRFVDCSEVRSREDLLRAVAGALEVPLAGDPAGGVDQLGRALAPRGALLLLCDNFEHMAAAGGPVLARWLEAAPGLRLLVTSRVGLGLAGEHRIELEPMDEPEAVTLFLERAREVSRGADPGTVDLELVRRLVGALEGLPLALELAAARTALLPVRTLLERVGRSFDVLGARREGPSRQATLERTIRDSWEMLTEAGQRALERCAVFRGGFTVEAAEEVVAPLPGAAEASVLDLIAGLRDRSLIRRADLEPGEPRYALFESVREFAGRRLDARGDRAEIEARHRIWCVTRAEARAAALRGPDYAQAARWLRLELDNLMAAIDGAIGVEPAIAARILLALRHVALTDGPVALYLERVSRVIEALPVAPGRIPLLLLRGELSHIDGRLEPAVADLRAALASARAADDREHEAEALSRLGYLLSFRVDPSAEGLCRSGLELARRLDDARLEALALDRLGCMLHLQGRLAEARTWLVGSVAVYQRLGDLPAEIRARSNLALMDLELGWPARARERLQRAAGLDRALGNRRSESLQCLNLGALALELGEAAEARTYLERACGLARSIGDRRAEGLARNDLALLELEAGRYDLARDHCVQAQRLFEALAEPLFEAFSWMHLGAIEAADDGIELAGEAFAAARRVIEPTGVATLLTALEVLEGFVDLAWARREGGAGAAERLARARARMARARSPRGETPAPAGSSSYVRLVCRLLEGQVEAGSEG